MTDDEFIHDELIYRIWGRREHLRCILQDIHGEPPSPLPSPPPSVVVAFDAGDEPPPEEAVA